MDCLNEPRYRQEKEIFVLYKPTFFSSENSHTTVGTLPEEVGHFATLEALQEESKNRFQCLARVID